LQVTLSKLQKKNKEEIELIGQLSLQCDQLVKDVKSVDDLDQSKLISEDFLQKVVIYIISF
jgi:hypothetical protein